MRQVPAFGQTHAHDGVAGFEESQKDCYVGGGAAVRLHIGRVSAKNLLSAVYRQLLRYVHVFAATVVTLTGVALGIFLGELAALCRHHGRRGVVFAGNQLDMVFLAGVFGQDGSPQFGIGLLYQSIAVVHSGVLKFV